jgi:mono/diheme cytochrome c family protein
VAGRRLAPPVAAALVVLGASACGAGAFERGEGLERAALPADVRDDYAVFAQRCSKCHSLARPLESGITNDEFWRMYVERMRRQPASGISKADTLPILRFLHWYSTRDTHPQAELAPKGSTE